ncbi:MAG: hypothetical protein H0V44_15305 [Planctomycetes bacterium]|nr:hypothetical protein [Planctomycetota bacterium]
MSVFLHPHRADILAAVALVARAREPLADGLVSLTAGDPHLSRWASRLAPALRSGTPAPDVLRRARLLSRHETRILAADADFVAALDRIASAAASPPRGIWWVRHLPVSCALAFALPATAWCLLLAANGMDLHYATDQLGITVGSIGRLSHQPLASALLLGAMLLAITAGDAAVRGVRGLRHLTHFWCPEVDRQVALLRLIQHARLGDDAPVRLDPLRSALARVGVGAWRPNQPVWDRDWRTWMFLTRWRLSPDLRKQSAQRRDLASRLTLLGIVDSDRGRPDWDAAETLCRERLDDALSSSYLLVRPVLLLTVWTGFMGMAMSVLAPLIRVASYL